jgi:predicted protein tyrosine phosphatase
MKLIVGPLDEVIRLCGEHRPSHLVSWLSPPALAPDLPPGLTPERRLLIASHDVTEPAEGLEHPGPAHVAELLDFAAGWSGDRPMLVHCWAGVSRSTAAAFVVACLKRPDLPEIELARQLRTLSPEATPNSLIVQIADDQLGRGGRMSQAVHAIGRGSETVLGRVFLLPLR